MKTSDYIADFLYAQGVTHVFELIGGMTTHMIDSLYQQNKIEIVCMRHEQAASFAADAMGRMSKVPGVAFATSGPGATNLLTGIGSCYFDSSPAVFITGQVNRSEQKKSKPIRQLGFQETDIVSVSKPITKGSWLVQRVEEIPAMLEKAFQVAMSGRPGPVLLDIPMDIQRAEINVGSPKAVRINENKFTNKSVLSALLLDLKSAKRPLILVGGGLRSAKACDLFRTWTELLGVPVINSLMAVDALPYNHPLRVGMIGSYGNRWGNLAIGKSDFILVLGSRLDIRQTGSDTRAFKSNRIIYHVDCEPGEVNNRVEGCVSIIMDLRSFLSEAIRISSNQKQISRSKWMSEIEKIKKNWPDTKELKGISGINPNIFMHQLSKVSKSASAYVVDVGQHQMWAAQSLELASHQRFLTSGGMGAMGFGLPAAIGASFASLKKPVVMISGDGGMQLNIQELQTVFHHKLLIKMIVLNNHCQGMVRQFQQSYFDERYQSTDWGYSAPDFASLAKAYGIKALTVEKNAEIPKSLKALWQDPSAPFLLHVVIDKMANAYPKIAFGRPLTEMEPHAKPIDIEST